MGLYDGHAWAELAKEAGFDPENTETAARSAFRFCADRLAEKTQEAEKLRLEREDLRMFCKGMANNIKRMLDT